MAKGRTLPQSAGAGPAAGGSGLSGPSGRACRKACIRAGSPCSRRLPRHRWTTSRRPPAKASAHSRAAGDHIGGKAVETFSSIFAAIFFITCWPVGPVRSKKRETRPLHHGVEDHGVVVSRALVVAGGKRLQSVQLAGKALQVVRSARHRLIGRNADITEGAGAPRVGIVGRVADKFEISLYQPFTTSCGGVPAACAGAAARDKRHEHTKTRPRTALLINTDIFPPQARCLVPAALSFNIVLMSIRVRHTRDEGGCRP